MDSSERGVTSAGGIEEPPTVAAVQDCHFAESPRHERILTAYAVMVAALAHRWAQRALNSRDASPLTRDLCNIRVEIDYMLALIGDAVDRLAEARALLRAGELRSQGVQ